MLVRRAQAVVHCCQCRTRAIGAVPDAPPRHWEIVLVNRIYGGAAPGR